MSRALTVGFLVVVPVLGCGGGRGGGAPTAYDESVATPEDTALDVTLTASDPDGDALTWTVDTQPAHGTLGGSAPALSYTPDTDYNGPDGFTFHVSDGTRSSNIATVDIAVAPVNDPPVAEDVVVWTDMDTPVSATFQASDPEGDGLTYEIVSGPSHGTLTGSGQVRTYQPEAGYVGTDTFTYRAHDGQDYSGAASVAMVVAGDSAPGTVWTWGYNENGQLGDGTTQSRYAPVQAQGLSGVKAVSARNRHCLAAKTDGTVWAWGMNDDGQLGDGGEEDRHVPVQVPGLGGGRAVAAGHYHSLALQSDGTVWAWGMNSNGQLGDGTTVVRYAPVQVQGLADVTAVAAGDDFSVALRSDGTVWAWGCNDYRQLGDDTRIDSYVPKQVQGLAGIKAIAAGWSHTLALKSDGTVWAWGVNRYGQLGLGPDLGGHTVPEQVVDLTGVTAIAAGHDHSLAVRADGTVWAWGYNYQGQLGDGTGERRTEPVQVCDLTGAAAVAAGAYHSLALKTDGTVWAWGSGSYGALGDGTGEDRPLPVQVQGLLSATTIAGGLYHSFAAAVTPNQPPVAQDDTVETGQDMPLLLTLQASDPEGDGLTFEIVSGPSNGTLSGAGPDITYQPDPGYTGADSFTYRVHDGEFYSGIATVDVTVSSNLAPVAEDVSATTDEGAPVAVTLQASDPESAALSYEVVTGPLHGTLSGAGPDMTYQPDGGHSGSDSFTYRAYDGGIYSNDATATIVTISTQPGTVWSWGDNFSGQLGDGTKRDDRLSPVQALAVNGLTAADAGIRHSLAMRTDGTVWAWGENYHGEMGNGTTGDDQLVPGQTLMPGEASAISARGCEAFTLRTDGTVWTWGEGDGTPTQVTGLAAVAAIDGRLAVKADGTVWKWQTASSTPVEVEGLTGAVAVAAGADHYLALKADGSVWAWGWNNHGQVGGTTVLNVDTPVQVPGLAGVSAIAAGLYHSLALQSDGTMWAWGFGRYGQLGDGTSGDRYTPFQVMTGVVAIAAGDDHSIAVKADGTVRSWGKNDHGQLGDGTATRRYLPVQVQGLTGIVAVAGGSWHSLAVKE